MFLARYHKKSPYWQIVYFVNGKRTSKSTGLTDRSKAEEFLLHFEKSFHQDSEIISIEELKQNTISLKSFTDEYKEYKKSIVSESYYERSIVPSINELINFVGDVDLSELNVRLLEKFLISIYSRSKHTAANYYRTIKSMLNKARSWGYIEKNYLTEFKLPKIQNKQPLFIGIDELQTIVNKIPKQIYKDITLFAFFTGMRAGEIVSLTWGCVNRNENLITVGSEGYTTKSKRLRYVPISKPVVQILSRNNGKGLKYNSEYVFSKKNGFPFTVNNVSKRFKKAVRETKLNQEIHFHTLRSSFGSYLLQKGVPIATISKILGHQSIAVTEKHYAALTVHNLFDAINHFDEIKFLKE